MRDIQGVIILCLAAANAFGLVFLVVFLAYGLCGVPRKLWNAADPREQLYDYYLGARRIQDDLDIAKTDLTLLRADVASLDPTVSDEDRDNLNRILSEISDLERRISLPHTNIASGSSKSKTETSLADLHAEVKQAMYLCHRLDYEFKRAVYNCERFDHVLSGKETSVYWKYIRYPLLRALSVFGIILTLIILWSELVVPFQRSVGLSIVYAMVHNASTRFISTVLVLYYMAGCAYWSIYQFRVVDALIVVPRIANGASLCFSATCLTRLLLPLCYNFLWMADLTTLEQKKVTVGNDKNKTTSIHVTYSELFGDMNVADFLGDWFNSCIPVFIPVLVVLIELKMIHRLLHWIGLDGYEVGEASRTVRIQHMVEGRVLVSRAAGRDLAEVVYAPRTRAEETSESDASPKPAVDRAAKYADWKAKRANRLEDHQLQESNA